MREKTSGAKLIVGVLFPGVLAILLLGYGLWVAIRDQDWVIAASSVLLVLLLIGPFLICALIISSREFLLGIGVLLVCLSGWAVFRAFTDENSTAGANLLWIPFAGYPVVLLGAFLDRMSR